MQPLPVAAIEDNWSNGASFLWVLLLVLLNAFQFASAYFVAHVLIWPLLGRVATKIFKRTLQSRQVLHYLTHRRI